MVAISKNHIFILVLFIFMGFSSPAKSEELYLIENLRKAQKGDYIVTYSNKNYTLLNIHHKTPEHAFIEEITIPSSKMENTHYQNNWKEWVYNGAPKHTAWVMYQIDLNSGRMLNMFSFTKNGWLTGAEEDNFLSSLLSIKFEKIPTSRRKKVGNSNALWQPQMIFEGQIIEGVHFDAWHAKWPKDRTELSGKAIDIYIPQEGSWGLPYFPYWLQITGLLGKAQLRIVDSGKNLVSPKYIPAFQK